MPIIPFKWTPAAWGLKGKSYKIAEAEYYYEGEELERKLLEINYTQDCDEKELAKLDIDYKYGYIKEFQKDLEKVKINYKDDLKERDEKILRLKYDHGVITQNDLEKGISDIREEPWVGVDSQEYDPSKGANGFGFGLDWNSHFINMLKENGFVGKTDEEIIDQWFNDLCTDIALREGYIEDLTEEDQTFYSAGPESNTRKQRFDRKTYYK